MAKALSISKFREKAESAKAKSEAVALSSVERLLVIIRPWKIFCVGLNYESHRVETGRPESKYPTLFTRFATTLVADGRPLVRPKLSEKFDYEGELAS